MRALRILVPLLLLGVAGEAGAQRQQCSERRPRVENITLRGNKSIASVDLKLILYTERAGRLRRWFGWNVGPTACLDSLELLRDTRRISAWYAMRGYPGTSATAGQS